MERHAVQAMAYGAGGRQAASPRLAAMTLPDDLARSLAFCSETACLICKPPLQRKSRPPMSNATLPNSMKGTVGDRLELRL